MRRAIARLLVEGPAAGRGLRSELAKELNVSVRTLWNWEKAAREADDQRHVLSQPNRDVRIDAFGQLVAYGALRGGARAFVAPLDVHLPSGDVVQPDVLYVAPGSPALARDAIRGVPDLVVEVVSPSRPDRDRFVKRMVYEANRVPEYWIADPDEGSIEVVRLDGDR